MNSQKILGLLWPPEAVITESLFRHFNCLAEVAGYLKNISNVPQKCDISIKIFDCGVQKNTAFSLAKIVYQCEVIAICINLNNICEAIQTAEFIRSIKRSVIIVAYGEGLCCGTKFLEKYQFFDYIIPNGQYELGLEIVLQNIYGIDKKYLHPVLTDRTYAINSGIVSIQKEVLLPPNDWGVPEISELPLEDYKKLGNEELHITACKGCPYGCEFCNEKYVGTKKIRYRNVDQLVGYMIKNKDVFSSAYLDASTFTYDRNWVIELCKKMISVKNDIIPWKTCTRLDCIDSDLIWYMGQANCKRISIGIESININIQKRNKKIIDYKKLKEFSKLCISNGIKPRGLLIIGLKGQEKEEILAMEQVFSELGMEIRVRVLQDFSVLHEENVKWSQLESLNRWLVRTDIKDLEINEIRKLEFPVGREGNYA